MDLVKDMIKGELGRYHEYETDELSLFIIAVEAAVKNKLTAEISFGSIDGYLCLAFKRGEVVDTLSIPMTTSDIDQIKYS